MAVSMKNPKRDNRPLRVNAEQLRRISELTIVHYDRSAEEYWEAPGITTPAKTMQRSSMRSRVITRIPFLILVVDPAGTSTIFGLWDTMSLVWMDRRNLWR